MGYYTNFTLEVIHDANSYTDEDEILASLESIVKWKPFSCLGSSTDETKWYSHDEHMIELSKKYKNLVFELEGVGEENHDHWKSYYVNGESHTVSAIVTFEPIDIEALKTKAIYKLIPPDPIELEKARKLVEYNEKYLASQK